MSNLLIPTHQTIEKFGQWRAYSVSKMRQLLKCPFAFYQMYFMNQQIIWSPKMVLGTAVHYMFEQFFKQDFKTPDTFANSCGEYWSGLCDGRYSSFGRKKPAEGKQLKIRFDSDNQSQFFAFRADSMSIARDFYLQNINYRHTEFHPVTEFSFAVPFRGFKLTGRIDRLQKVFSSTEANEEIWDYKPYVPRTERLLHDLQLTGYNHAYEYLFHRQPAGLRIYGYYHKDKSKRIKGELGELIAPRTAASYDEFERTLREINAYVFGVLFWRHFGFLPHGFALRDFNYFPVQDVENGYFGARYNPESDLCQNCVFREQECAIFRQCREKKPVLDDLLAVLLAKKESNFARVQEKTLKKKILRARIETDLFIDEEKLSELSDYIGQQLQDRKDRQTQKKKAKKQGKARVSPRKKYLNPDQTMLL